MKKEYREGSLTLRNTVALGTGVMIGAGIFALTGQVAELAGRWYPLAFLVAAVVSAFSAYTYSKVSSRYPSSGGIAMILEKAYGSGTTTGATALLMVLSMIINESLVARTFATYALVPFGSSGREHLVPILAVALLAVTLAVNLAGNELVGAVSNIAAAVKVGGIVLFSLAALWAADFGFRAASRDVSESSAQGFVAGVALAILAYKGFTTITNSGDEVVEPERNVGRAIVISLAICLGVYLLVCWAVGASLSIDEIVTARDYALAEAAKPALGSYGTWFTVAIALVATASGLLASIFAVSRMLTMLTKMRLIPHRHFGMPGGVRQHTLVYTVITAGLLAAFFDLSRIASLGAILYLTMDVIVHWGVFRNLREDVEAHGALLLTAIALDLIALATFLALKIGRDPGIVAVGGAAILLVFSLERFYLGKLRKEDGGAGHTHG